MSENYWDKNERNEYWKERIKATGSEVATETKASGLTQFMTQIFTWMAFGLGITGIASAVTIQSEALLGLIFGTPLLWVLIIGELALVIWFGVALRKGASATKLLTMFLVYSALNGLTLSAIFLIYAVGTIAQAFFVTAGTFGAMALYGYVTKKDLSGIGYFARMALFGLIIAMVANFFMQSAMMDYVISLIGVGVFTILTAYDTQKLKNYYHQNAANEEGLKRMAIGGALMLYLDFINLFLFILRLMGGRR
ncbi:MAG: Bax inhibitor-1/YccA family protein [bacterium]|nr:Bax inhibitor-1/YccA family protein [bacterium]MBU1919013.1 Bax inhibitor-1/YccA family protein [bacterium]